MLVAAEEGIVDLDEAAGPPGATLRHLLAHASGLPFEAGAPIAQPGTRRIYSNYGFEVAAALVAERAEMPFADYFAVGVGGNRRRAATARRARASKDRSTDLLALARELPGADAHRAPRRSPRRARCSSPGSSACCPASAVRSRTTGASASSSATGSRRTGPDRGTRRLTFGHFGRSGTFLWVDPEAGIALACLTDLDFGDWAVDAWPRLADAVLEELEQ